MRQPPQLVVDGGNERLVHGRRRRVEPIVLMSTAWLPRQYAS